MRIGNKEIAQDNLAAICRKWKIRRLELFGRANRPTPSGQRYRSVSRVRAGAEQWSLMDLGRADEEFVTLFRRGVDPVDRKSLERSANWTRRDAILRATEVVYGG
jgi:hypothetical protein